MQVTGQLAMSDNDRGELARILGCGQQELEEKLAPYASAALEEFASMFLGQRVFNRGSDIREYRLYLLIKHAFSQKIPSEQEVCKLFQCTASSSRSLIRAVMSKYQYLLKDAIHGTLRDYLGKAKVNGQDASAVLAIDNRNIVEQLNRTLSEMDSSLPPVQKKRASVSTYEMKLSSYYRLCEHFGLAQK